MFRAEDFSSEDGNRTFLRNVIYLRVRIQRHNPEQQRRCNNCLRHFTVTESAHLCAAGSNAMISKATAKENECFIQVMCHYSWLMNVNGVDDIIRKTERECTGLQFSPRASEGETASEKLERYASPGRSTGKTPAELVQAVGKTLATF